MKVAPITLVVLFLLVAAAGAGQLPSAIVPAGLSVEIHASADDPSYFNFNDFDMIRNLGVKFVRDDYRLVDGRDHDGTLRLHVLQSTAKCRCGSRPRHGMDSLWKSCLLWHRPD